MLLIDNYDSFTYNLVHLLSGAGLSLTVVKNDAASAAEIEAMRPDALLLSAGPGTPEEAGVTLELIARLGDRIPMLGICLGHQCIAHALGGRVRRAEQLLHGKTCQVTHDGRGVYLGLPPQVAMARYNSLVVEEASLPSGLAVSARSETGEVMGLRSQSGLLEGVQFHPESVLSESGPQLARNWVRRLRPVPLGSGEKQ